MLTHDLTAELMRLPRKFGQRGVLFLGVLAGAERTCRGPPRSRVYHSRSCSIRSGEWHARRDARAIPEGLVLAADGQVFYRGRIGEPDRFELQRRLGTRANPLESALDAMLADEMPVVTSTEPTGQPLRPVIGTHVGDRAEEITFTKHVAPIMWQNCARCHRPGQVGPFSLLTYRDAAKRANFLVDVMVSGQMPPWKPHAGVGVFLDALRLSATETETFERWAETGCKPGDPADLPPLPQFNDGWQLGQPDVILTMPEPYQIPAEGPDIYRSFSLPFPLGQDVTINGVEFRPGNRRVAHHSRTYLDDTGDARRRDLA